MQPKVIVSASLFEIIINRLCQQLIENHNNFKDAVIIGLQPKGIFLSERLTKRLQQLLNLTSIPSGKLDVTFYRDDFRRRDEILIPNTTQIDVVLENKSVILVDDVLYTGRTVRSGMDALLAFGRPKKVELLVLVDRRFSRDLPIQANYVGKTVDTIISEKVKVEWKEKDGEDRIILFSKSDKV